MWCDVKSSRLPVDGRRRDRRTTRSRPRTPAGLPVPTTALGAPRQSTSVCYTPHGTALSTAPRPRHRGVGESVGASLRRIEPAPILGAVGACQSFLRRSDSGRNPRAAKERRRRRGLEPKPDHLDMVGARMVSLSGATEARQRVRNVVGAQQPRLARAASVQGRPAAADCRSRPRRAAPWVECLADELHRAALGEPLCVFGHPEDGAAWALRGCANCPVYLPVVCGPSYHGRPLMRRHLLFSRPPLGCVLHAPQGCGWTRRSFA